MKTDPPRGCRRCPRLVAYRRENQKLHPDWFNGAVPSWGPVTAPFLIVGLAPGLKGANRTGRIFTGDSSGQFLFDGLLHTGFAVGHYGTDGIDDLLLNNMAITNIVACLPPANKPTGEEINKCQPFLEKRLSIMPNIQAILCLGRLSHMAILKTLKLSQKNRVFQHGARHSFEVDKLENRRFRFRASQIMIFDSYHCSRYNTQTKRLTPMMFHTVLLDIKRYIDETNEKEYYQA